jgi:hypothetical protein
VKAPDYLTRQELCDMAGPRYTTQTDIALAALNWSEDSQAFLEEYRVCCHTCKHIMTPQEQHEGIFERDFHDWRKRRPLYWLVCARCPVVSAAIAERKSA